MYRPILSCHFGQTDIKRFDLLTARQVLYRFAKLRNFYIAVLSIRQICFRLGGVLCLANNADIDSNISLITGSMIHLTLMLDLGLCYFTNTYVYNFQILSQILLHAVFQKFKVYRDFGALCILVRNQITDNRSFCQAEISLGKQQKQSVVHFDLSVKTSQVDNYVIKIFVM